MPAKRDLTIEILKQIRDELRTTREELTKRIDATNTRLDSTNTHLDTTNSRLDALERRQTETEVRLSTELIAVAGAVRELRDAFVADRDLRKRLDDHEGRLAELERHAG